MHNNNDTKFTLAFLGFTLIALLVFLSMRMVPVGHIGVVTSFGRITGTSLEPGLHFTCPWHFVKRIDNRVKHTETSTPCFSKDLQLLEIDADIMATVHSIPPSIDPVAGSIPVDPKPYTIRQLFWMTEGRDKHVWSVVSAVMALVANCHKDSKSRALRPDDFNPMLTRKER